MKIKKCDKCGAHVMPIVAPCPGCAGISFTYLTEEESSKVPVESILKENTKSKNTFSNLPITLDEPRSRSKDLSDTYSAFRQGNSSSKAIQSAKIVDSYGTYIQFAGVVIGAIYFISIWWLGSQFGNGFSGFIAGLLIGILIIAIAIVNGALYKMISNYIIAKLENRN